MDSIHHSIHSDEDYDFDYDSDDLDLRRPYALPVASNPIGDPNLPPVSGEEYLRRVRTEADTLPSIVSVSHSCINTTTTTPTTTVVIDDIRPTKRPRMTITTINNPHCTTNSTDNTTSIPSIDNNWANTIITDVIHLHNQLNQLRSHLSKQKVPELSVFAQATDIALHKLNPTIREHIPTTLNATKWCRFLYGDIKVSNKDKNKLDITIHHPESSPQRLQDDTQTNSTNNQTKTYLIKPGRYAIRHPNVLVALTQATLIGILKFHSNWIRSERTPVMIEYLAETSYAILIGIDPDVLRLDDAYSIRTLGKACIQSINKLTRNHLHSSNGNELISHSDKDNNNNNNNNNSIDEVIKALRIVLVVISIRFGQRDLCQLI